MPTSHPHLPGAATAPFSPPSPYSPSPAQTSLSHSPRHHLPPPPRAGNTLSTSPLPLPTYSQSQNPAAASGNALSPPPPPQPPQHPLYPPPKNAAYYSAKSHQHAPSPPSPHPVTPPTPSPAPSPAPLSRRNGSDDGLAAYRSWAPPTHSSPFPAAWQAGCRCAVDSRVRRSEGAREEKGARETSGGEGALGGVGGLTGGAGANEGLGWGKLRVGLGLGFIDSLVGSRVGLGREGRLTLGARRPEVN